MFGHIVPCGIRDKGVTSIAALWTGDPTTRPSMRAVADAVAARFVEHFGYEAVDREDVAWKTAPPVLADGATVDVPLSLSGGYGEPADATPVRLLGRLAAAGVEAPADDPATGRPFRRPEWMRVRADLGPGYRETKRLVRDLSLHTVCEEAGCPNIYECWADRTATFMILGERCTRACGFCLVDTRKPLPLDPEEPGRVADAVATLGLEHVVITSVARDDVADGGAAGFAATIRRGARAEPDDARRGADPRLQGRPRRARDRLRRPPRRPQPQPGDGGAAATRGPAVGRVRRARSSVLARAKDAGLTTKSGLILGMGEEAGEVRSAITDLRNVGVDLLTLGQYLRPSARHLPVVRWWTPDEFAELGAFAESLGFSHVESGPLVRSSYHAKRGADSVDTPASPVGAAGTGAGR